MNETLLQIKAFINICILRREKNYNQNKFYLSKGISRYRYTYPLNENSVVFDLGGYKGEWTEEIYRRYKPYIHCFEPVKEYYDILRNKFIDTNKIKVYNYGLGADTIRTNISLNGPASSALNIKGLTETIEIKSISEFIEEHNVTVVDVIKMNIEGMEYEILENLLDKKMIKMFKEILVQFHVFVDKSETRRLSIQERLSETHVKTYDFPFVWENWRLK